MEWWIENRLPQKYSPVFYWWLLPPSGKQSTDYILSGSNKHK